MYEMKDIIDCMLIFAITIIVSETLSCVFRIVKRLMQGCYMEDMAEELMKENDKLIKEEDGKINIDNDLQKYFNYTGGKNDV